MYYMPKVIQRMNKLKMHLELRFVSYQGLMFFYHPLDASPEAATEDVL